MYGERDATPTRKLQFVDEPKKYQSLSKADVYKKSFKFWLISIRKNKKSQAHQMQILRNFEAETREIFKKFEAGWKLDFL